MKGLRKTGAEGTLIHCYQNTREGRLLFYNESDYLLFFTLFCTIARRYRIRLLKLCLMPDHIHMALIAGNNDEVSQFIQVFTAAFSREHNRTLRRRGPLFNHPFGSAPKYGEKKVRTTLIYIDNNPVERHLCEKAENYRWNFLAYGTSPHPFSNALRRKEASRALRRAITVVEERHQKGLHLPYPLMQRLFAPLSSEEREQLTDFTVCTYSIIRHELSIAHFGSYENELLSVHATTGSEYELKEAFTGRSDAVYGKMTEWIMDTYPLEDIHEVLSWTIVQKMALFARLNQRFRATTEQIAKYLHLPLKKGGG